MTGRELGWRTGEVDGVQLSQRTGLFDVGTPVEANMDRRLTKLVTFLAPRRWLTRATMNVEGMVAEIEETVSTRGLITHDGQVLNSLRRVGPWEACFEGMSIDSPLEDVVQRNWGVQQQTFFGLKQPFQMADDPDWFTSSSLSVRIADPYLSPEELIVGVIHGSREQHFFTCPCHYAQVVYTTRHRLVCMSCGATHVVLRKPVLTRFRNALVPEEWDELFGEGGGRNHEPLDLAIVDVQDVERAAPYVWATSQWEEALGDYILVARPTPEQAEQAIRGYGCDASVLLEAGWQPVREPAPPAFQMMDGTVELDMMESAGRALAAGAAAYLAAYVHPEKLIDAVKDLFHAVELLLKVRLEASDPLGLSDQPNNPTVLTRLAAVGVLVSGDEANTVLELRQLRNALQHNTARFNQRAILALSRRTLIFLDRFCLDEINAWIGDVIAPDDWHRLLALEELHAHAVGVADFRLADRRADADANITVCPRCGEKAMFRPHPNAGASCLVCGNIPAAEH